MEVQTRVVSADGVKNLIDAVESEVTALCPRCSNDSPVKLEKTDPMSNTCYRCRTCGHIFSPRD